MKLHGKVIIEGDINVLTGLHIGGAATAVEVGGLDNVIVRNPLTDKPYIPGSSIRGKMRSLYERRTDAPQNWRIGQATIHVCQSAEEYQKCDVCHIFGVPGELPFGEPTRLIIRDVMDLEAEVDAEVKWEAAIDRVTSAAVPRQMERVPAGAVFKNFEFVFAIYDSNDYGRLFEVFQAMLLLEDDYLGGLGARGSGKIRFENMAISARAADAYESKATWRQGLMLDDVFADWAVLDAWVKEQIPVKAG